MDYVDPRLLEAPQRAAEVLLRHWGEWDCEWDAYKLLRRYEDEVGVPVTYDIVEEAVRLAREAASRRLAVEEAEVGA